VRVSTDQWACRAPVRLPPTATDAIQTRQVMEKARRRRCRQGEALNAERRAVLFSFSFQFRSRKQTHGRSQSSRTRRRKKKNPFAPSFFHFSLLPSTSPSFPTCFLPRLSFPLPIHLEGQTKTFQKRERNCPLMPHVATALIQKYYEENRACGASTSVESSVKEPGT